jgi:hypothetical protein
MTRENAVNAAANGVVRKWKKAMTLFDELQINGFDILMGGGKHLVDQLAALIKRGFDGLISDVSNLSPVDTSEPINLSPLGDFWLMAWGLRVHF